jgi:hypothetical protein
MTFFIMTLRIVTLKMHISITPHSEKSACELCLCAHYNHCATSMSEIATREQKNGAEQWPVL